MARKKVYIVADGMVTSLGAGTEANVEAVRAGKTGVALHSGLVEDESGNDLPVMCGLVGDFNGDIDGMTRTESIAVAAVSEAAGKVSRQDGAAERRRALIFSSTKGNIGILDAAPEDTAALPEEVFLDCSAKRIGRHFGYHPEDVFTVSNACISGVSSIVVAKRLIEYGRYDEVTVVGVDTISRFIASGFASFRSLSASLCRPYDASRDGLNLGEAAAAVILSDCADGASAPVVVSGGSVSDDANHISGPSRTGDGLYFAMRDAMEDAGVTDEDISFVNLHGTATVYNDEMESKAVGLAGLSGKPVQSLKPYIGHTLGASGVVETVFCIRQLLLGEVWGTPGFASLGVPVPLSVSSMTRQVRMRHCIKTASGFGGCNAAIVLSLPEHARDMEEKPLPGFRKLKDVKMCGAGDFHSFIREKYKALGLNDMKFYKMDDMSKLGYIASHLLLDGLSFSPEDMAVILQNRSASLDSDLKHLRNITEGPGASPAVFVYTLPNVASGEISIRHKIKGDNTFFISSSYDKEGMEEYARMVLASSKAKYCIVGWLEYLGGEYDADFELIEKI